MLGALIGVGSSIIGGIMNRRQKKADKKDAARESAAMERKVKKYREGYDEGISELDDLQQVYADQADMSVDERFGDAIGVMRDRVSEENAGTRRAAIRAAAAGGDLIGTGNIIASSLAESGNEAIGSTEAELAVKNQYINQSMLGAQGDLINDKLGANSNMYAAETGQANLNADRSALRKTARRQNTVGVIGGLANFGLNFLKDKD